MPEKGETVKNQRTGDCYEFIETAEDTNGKYVTLKATIHSKGLLVPNHIHTLQDETFEVISGELSVWMNGSTKIFSAGEKVTLPKSVPHNHFNNQDCPVVYIHTVSPALDFGYLIKTVVGLAADGKSKNGKNSLIQDLVTLKYIDSKTYRADMPVGIQKTLAGIMAPIGRLLGYRAIYKKYSDIEK